MNELDYARIEVVDFALKLDAGEVTPYQFDFVVEAYIQYLDEVRFHCADCEMDTNLIGEYYMVKDEVWEEATAKSRAKMLCLGCLEERLGKELVGSDFTDCPLNTIHEGQSEMLRDRLRRVGNELESTQLVAE